MPYKQVFSHVYAATLAGSRLAERIALLPDGQLTLHLGNSTDVVDVGLSNGDDLSLSQMVMTGRADEREAVTPDGRYRVELDFSSRNGLLEYWLMHRDAATGRVRRAKLNTETPDKPLNPPRVSASPHGNYFIVDDSGTVRLYSTPHLTEIGVFQVAHANTDNAIISLAVSADEYLIVGLSLWKDIVLYDVVKRRVTFVRQIRDSLGWYERQPVYLMLVGGAALIVAVGASGNALAVNAFRFVPLT